MNPDRALDEFTQLVKSPEIDLGVAALAIARIEHPELASGPVLAELDQLAARSSVSTAGGGRRALDRLCSFLFEGEKFRGNAEDYYDPRNSCLNDVLDRRLGIPITLAVVVMEVGRRVGLEIMGIGLPGHFCVGAKIGRELVMLDPFASGRALDRADAEAIASRAVGRAVKLTDAHFAPTSRTQIVVRMLRNLEGIYARREDWSKALAVIDRLLVVDADAPTHRRDRGTVLVKLGELHRGASEWERYLTRYPQARDAAAFREELRRVRQTLAEKN
jgi:regulator of sirC expression with transglutaminase-like and TPR domain